MKKTTLSGMVCLAALLAAVLSTAGCSLKRSPQDGLTLDDVLASYQEHLSRTIDDPERVDRLVDIGEELFLKLRDDVKKLRETAEEFDRQNKRYDASREELTALLAAMDGHRRRMAEEVLAARVRAVSLTTPEEWGELMSRRMTLLDLIRETPGLI